MAEPAAGLLDEAMCDRFSSAFIRRIVEEVQDDHFLFIFHNCGNHRPCYPINDQHRRRRIAFRKQHGHERALQEVPAHILVFGNIDPVGAVQDGPAG